MKEIQKRMNIEEFKKTSSKPIKLLTKREYYDNIYLESMKDYFGDDVPNCVYEAIESGYGIYIYRIDLEKSKKGTYINFYADDMIDCEDAVYTYNNIPPECLRLIDIIK